MTSLRLKNRQPLLLGGEAFFFGFTIPQQPSGRFRSKLALRTITTSRGGQLWKGQRRIFCRELCRRQKTSGICFFFFGSVFFRGDFLEQKSPLGHDTCHICFMSVFLVSHCVFFSFCTTKTHLLIAQCSSLFSFPRRTRTTSHFMLLWVKVWFSVGGTLFIDVLVVWEENSVSWCADAAWKGCVGWI